MDNSKTRILIVEDDQFLREFYQELLQSEGYTVDVAPDGEIASNKVHQGDFHLILLDIMLPKKDGLQILRENKMAPSLKPNGKIVMLTNLGQDAVIKEAFQLGAVGYLIKSSLNPDQVLNEIHNYLNPAK